VRCHRVFS